jgi:16S rRNA (guanine966-N2)-methyltransferase
MRIVAGTHGGRRLKAPGGLKVRPTPDKVREALFAILGADVAGCRFLDLFAGTGAVGLEALSRGGITADFVEQSRTVTRILRENIDALGFTGQTRVWTGRLPAALGALVEAGLAFDIVFADPPYELGRLDRLLAAPALTALAPAGATLVVEHRYSERFEPGLWEVRQTRRYGDTALTFCAPRAKEN